MHINKKNSLEITYFYLIQKTESKEKKQNTFYFYYSNVW